MRTWQESEASPSQYSCRDESNELSSARLPDRCVFPGLRRAGKVDDEWTSDERLRRSFFRVEPEGDKNKRGRENRVNRKNSVRAPTGLPKYVRPAYTPSLAPTQLLLRREDWVEEGVVVVVGEGWINTTCL